MSRAAGALRALAGACLLFAGAAAAGATVPPDTADSHMSAPARLAVFLVAPPAGYHQPPAPLTFGAVEKSRCLGCHGLPGFMVRDSVAGRVLRLTVDSVEFQRSAHGMLACTQCHGDIHGFPHAFVGGSRPKVGCDADCHARDAKGLPVRHQDQVAEFRTGVHRRGLAGDPDSPDCVYCHGEGDPHRAVRVKEIPRARQLELCASCHEDPERMRRAKVAPDAVSSYRQGLHYAALRLGEPRAPICQDCHDTHGVRAERDTASTTSAGHLRGTCAQKGCHPGAGARFAASGGDHSGMRSHRGTIVNRAGGLLAWIGGIILAIMALGVVLDLQRPLRAAVTTASPGALVPRLSATMRLQHGVLVASFTLLALTGLPLRYPDVAALRALDRVFGGWDGARAVHRISGGCMLALALVHAIWAVVRLVRARFDVSRAWPLLPAGSDVREAWQTLLYQLRLRPAPPEHGRDEFRARVHYLAVLWGVPVMALTGLVLWLAGPLAGRLPRSALALATVAHGEEALVAVAIVLLWHFYNVHFAPGRGLRALTLVDGKVTGRHVAAVHPRDAGGHSGR